MKYNWQQPDWPEFRYDTSAVDDTQMEAIINTMVAEAIKTSEIEVEYFSRQA